MTSKYKKNLETRLLNLVLCGHNLDSLEIALDGSSGPFLAVVDYWSTGKPNLQVTTTKMNAKEKKTCLWGESQRITPKFDVLSSCLRPSPSRAKYIRVG